MELTEQQVDTVVSYADGFHRVLKETGIVEAELKDLLLDHNVEQCPTCGWFVECGELIASSEDECEDGPDGFCDNCRRYGYDVDHQ